MAGAGVHYQSSGFVDDDDVVVDIEHPKVHVGIGSHSERWLNWIGEQRYNFSGVNPMG
jgi:hypothetical protein